MVQQYRKQIVAGLALLGILAAYLLGDVDASNAIAQSLNTVSSAL